MMLVGYYPVLEVYEMRCIQYSLLYAAYVYVRVCVFIGVCTWV